MFSVSEQILKCSKLANDFAFLCNRKSKKIYIFYFGVEHGEFYMHEKYFCGPRAGLCAVI